jgi:hypothetical protein
MQGGEFRWPPVWDAHDVISMHEGDELIGKTKSMILRTL